MKIDTEFDIGDVVYDDLSDKVVTVVGISISLGYVDDTNTKYLGGSACYHIEFDKSHSRKLRYSWEITKMPIINKEGK